jgi:hypothetical protein
MASKCLHIKAETWRTHGLLFDCTLTANGEVFVWDVEERRCIRKFRDEGCTKAVCIHFHFCRLGGFGIS